MNITNQQIQAEIDELIAEANRRVASVKGIFSESAQLRRQAELLKQFLALRTETERHQDLLSFVMIGFVIEDQIEPTAFCAFTWKGPASNPADVRLSLKIDWQQRLPVDVASYFGDLLEDWKITMQTQPDVVLAMTRELSVGPIRLMKQASMDRDQVELLLEEQLGQCLQIPGMVLVK